VIGLIALLMLLVGLIADLAGALIHIALLALRIALIALLVLFVRHEVSLLRLLAARKLPVLKETNRTPNRSPERR
jgi:hypothetical protein